MKIKIFPIDLELIDTFRISRESRSVQKTLIVELFDNGFSGFGEATATKYYGQSIDSMLNILERLNAEIGDYHFETPQQFLYDFEFILNDNSFVKCALDCAAHDLYGKKIGKPVYDLWGLKWKNTPMTSYTIGIDSIDKMIEKIKKMPWPIYKIKLGAKEDIKIIEALRKHTNSVFRVDANNGWNAKQTIEYSNILKEMNVEFIEQPLPPSDIDGMKQVFEKSALPVIADESCLVESDIKKCFGYFHGINIKLMKCGGLIAAQRMIMEAREYNMEIMVGCMTESSVGVSAIAHLLPLIDYLDMDGPLLIKNDPADGVRYDYGKIILPRRNGLGVILR